VAVTATLKYMRVSPFKVRKYTQLFKGKSVEEARAILAYHPSPTCEAILKLLNSAVANAENNHDLDPELLIVKNVVVDGASTYKRIRPRARGRANRILKRTSHITIEVDIKAEHRVKRVEPEPQAKAAPKRRLTAMGRKAKAGKAVASETKKAAAKVKEPAKPAKARAKSKAKSVEEEAVVAKPAPKRKRAAKKVDAAMPEPADVVETGAAEPTQDTPAEPAGETK
jgi:large subunit ribosomal protein L22